MSNIIDFEKEKKRRQQIREHDVVDTHDAVLDLSDLVYDLTVSDDALIISMGDEEKS